MSMKQNIEIDGKQVPFKVSAAILRIYRMKFHRDIYKDLRFLVKSVGDGSEENSNLDMFSLLMFENIAYIMAKYADTSIPDPHSNAINMFYKQIILHRGLPFEVKVPSARPLYMSVLSEKQLNEELEKGYADMKAGRAKPASKVFSDIRKNYNV